MAVSEIFIISGLVDSGKTTSILNWKKGRNVSGILTPKIDGKRMFMDAKSEELFSMEAATNEEMITVGKYQFSKTAFERANQIILNAKDSPETDWLLIDELGPLELEGEGFAKAFKAILLDRRELKLMLVIRESLLTKVTDYFGIGQYQLFRLNR